MRRIHITTPDGSYHVHVESLQSGSPQLRILSNGSLQVYTVVDRPPNPGSGSARTYSEEVLGTYRDGSTYVID